MAVYTTAPFNGTRLTASRWVVINAKTGEALTKPMKREDALKHELELRRTNGAKR